MDQKTIDAYNELAKEYDEETADFWERFPRTIIDKFVEYAHGTVLDVGSGPGRDGLILQELGCKVICLDASEAMVKLSAEKGLTSVTGDFNALPFPDESLDGVWAYTSLLHVPKAEINKPLMEIKRVLKRDGAFGLGLIEGTTEEYRESLGTHKPRWFSFYGRSEIEDILKQIGFEIICFEQFQPKNKNYLNFISKKIGAH
jgi:ubiquinone/menaquinone biosynthesis C-methylase UbiE